MNESSTDVSDAASRPRAMSRAGLVALCTLFLISGMPALVYQLVWQRSLFAMYGINIESVTMVVTAFMLGLGLGGIVGGALSTGKRAAPLLIFALMELGIALFGVFSLDLFDAVGDATVGAPGAVAGLLSFLLLLLPTLGMGATLPLLTAHLVVRSGNVGRSVGLLYFVNTLGSAIACFAVALWVMGALGCRGAVFLAAAMNALVGGGALLAWLGGRARTGQAAHAVSSQDTAPCSNSPRMEHQGVRQAMSLKAAMVLGFLCGFISLSYEILWYRACSFTSGGVAASFALLLGAYLFGIAMGSLVSRRFCRPVTEQSLPRQLFTLALFLIAANGTGYLTVPLSAELVSVSEAGGIAPYLGMLGAVAFTAALLGAAFPLICHYGIRPDQHAGARLSYLYLANIIGSALGSLITGFVLMDVWPLRAIALALALGGLCIGAGILLTSGLRRMWLLSGLALVGVIACAMAAFHGSLFADLYERLQFKNTYQPGRSFTHIVETKSGVITVDPDGSVYGGGLYDGRFNTGLVDDPNGVIRVYALSAFHSQPRDVLMIGLSSGSWAQIVANHPQVASLTIVEINPGYLELIRSHDVVAGLLSNPKVTMHIDDGRRWLRRNPDAHFDAVVSNTTFHWRAHVSNLLSAEFLELVRAHLRPGGVFLYNTTGSERVQRTAIDVFPHAWRVCNFMLVSDSPLVPDKPRWRSVLEGYQIEGRPVFDLGDALHRTRLEEVLSMLDTRVSSSSNFYSIEPRESIVARTADVAPITDDNMGTEWENRVLR